MSKETHDLIHPDYEISRAKALDHCRKLEKEQKLSATSLLWAYFSSQFAAVVFSDITPVLILLDDIPKYVQAIPPTIASISAGLAVYHWRASSIRSRIAFAALENERLNYELRIGPDYGSEFTDEQALTNFRNRVTEINLGALEEWQKVVMEEARKANSFRIEP